MEKIQPKQARVAVSLNKRYTWATHVSVDGKELAVTRLEIIGDANNGMSLMLEIPLDEVDLTLQEQD